MTQQKLLGVVNLSNNLVDVAKAVNRQAGAATAALSEATREMALGTAQASKRFASRTTDALRSVNHHHQAIAQHAETAAKVARVAVGVSAIGAAVAAPTGMAAAAVAVGLVSAPVIVTAAPIVATVAGTVMAVSAATSLYSNARSKKDATSSDQSQIT